MSCPGCGYFKVDGARYCPECGERQPVDSVTDARSEAIRAQAERLIQSGLAAHEAGQPDESETICREALKLFPDSTSGHSLLGSLLQEKGDLEAALAEVAEVVRLNPASGADRAWYRRLRRSVKPGLSPGDWLPWNDRVASGRWSSPLHWVRTRGPSWVRRPAVWVLGASIAAFCCAFALTAMAWNSHRHVAFVAGATEPASISGPASAGGRLDSGPSAVAELLPTGPGASGPTAVVTEPAHNSSAPELPGASAGSSGSGSGVRTPFASPRSSQSKPSGNGPGPLPAASDVGAAPPPMNPSWFGPVGNPADAGVPGSAIVPASPPPSNPARVGAMEPAPRRHPGYSSPGVLVPGVSVPAETPNSGAPGPTAPARDPIHVYVTSVSQGQTDYDHGDYARAVNDYQSALRAAPSKLDEARVRQQLGMAYGSMGAPREAEREFGLAERIYGSLTDGPAAEVAQQSLNTVRHERQLLENGG